jgi:hypothetical protein
MLPSDRNLTTADMANPSRPTEENLGMPAEGTEGRQLRAVPARDMAQQEPVVTPLLGADEAGSFNSRWQEVQAEFVDDPRHAVEDADHLVAEAIQRLAQVFADQRAELERQWDRGDDISTEDLRVSLQHYRSFFQRLLAA